MLYFMFPWPWSPQSNFAFCKHRGFHVLKINLFLQEAPTPFLCPIFSLCFLPCATSLSYVLENGKLSLVEFKGFSSLLCTLYLTLWQALSVSSAWCGALVCVCVCVSTFVYVCDNGAYSSTHPLSLQIYAEKILSRNKDANVYWSRKHINRAINTSPVAILLYII